MSNEKNLGKIEINNEENLFKNYSYFFYQNSYNIFNNSNNNNNNINLQ
jgi:hypothetical protein